MHTRTLGPQGPKCHGSRSCRSPRARQLQTSRGCGSQRGLESRAGHERAHGGAPPTSGGMAPPTPPNLLRPSHPDRLSRSRPAHSFPSVFSHAHPGSTCLLPSIRTVPPSLTPILPMPRPPRRLGPAPSGLLRWGLPAHRPPRPRPLRPPQVGPPGPPRSPRPRQAAAPELLAGKAPQTFDVLAAETLWPTAGAVADLRGSPSRLPELPPSPVARPRGPAAPSRARPAPRLQPCRGGRRR